MKSRLTASKNRPVRFVSSGGFFIAASQPGQVGWRLDFAATERPVFLAGVFHQDNNDIVGTDFRRGDDTACHL